MMGLSHSKNHLKPGAKSGESDLPVDLPGRPIHFHSSANALLSPKQNAYSNGKRIPIGKVYAEIPLEAAKAYPIRLFDGTGLSPKIAYADWNTKGELNKLVIKLEPAGGKTSPHPQIAMFVKGPYHIENLLYVSSDPYAWATWMELYLDPRNLNLDNLIDGLLRIKLALEGIKT